MKTELIYEKDLIKAASLLCQGEIVAFPTETVYGLGACIFLEEAIKKIFFAKGRPSDNPLIAHIGNLSEVAKIASNVPPVFYRLAEEFFPGPLTLVVEKGIKVPSIVSGGLSTIAIRMPKHPLALELIRLVKEPIVAPSANLSGKPSSTELLHVLEDFNGIIPAIIVGEKSAIGIESTVVSLLSDKVTILRPGSISQEELEEFLKEPVSLASSCEETGEVFSPGMKYRHYAPLAKVYLFDSVESLLCHFTASFSSKKMVLANDLVLENCFPLIASSFYANLRLADRLGCEEVLILCDSLTKKNKGLMNRIEKASGCF
jgi:L-threonylcarbamoyladenylate synthase